MIETISSFSSTLLGVILVVKGFKSDDYSMIGIGVILATIG